MLYSEEVFNEMYEEIGYMSKEIGLSEDAIKDMVYTLSDSMLSEYMETHVKMSTDIREIEVYNAIDNMHSYINSVKFLIEDDAFCHTGNVEDLLKYPLEDAIFDFSSGMYHCRLSKCRYTLDGSKEAVFKLTILVKLSNVKVYTCDMCFILSKLPRYFVIKMGRDSNINEACHSCGKCNISRCTVDNMPWNTLIFGKLKRESGNCKMNADIKRLTGHDIDELFNVCIYALSSYVNRARRSKVNKQLSGVKVSHKKHEPKSKSSNSNYITIKDYVAYERSEYKGGHHSSPVKHNRRGHLRHYKNGKIVEVKPCVVNKDKKDSTYVIK